MIQVTETAATELKSVLASNGAPSDRGLKLVAGDEGHMSLTIDKPQLGDDVVKDGDRPLLIVDSTIARHLDGVVFDVAVEERSKGQGSRFVLRGLEERG
jgi:hypothetical protein